MSEEKIYLYPVWVRLWHLANAIFCLLLIISGVSMQFSNPKFPLIRFDVAVSVHNIFGILIAANYVIFFVGNLWTKNGNYYKIDFPGFAKELMGQFHYYTRGLFKGEHPPFPVTRERKFNPLQQMSYVLMMYIFVPFMILSGLSLMYPDVIPTNFFGFSGLHLTDLVHVISGFIISIFMFVHIYFCTIGKTALSNFRSMVNGYHEPH